MQIKLQNKTDRIRNELRDFNSYFIHVSLWILSTRTQYGAAFYWEIHSPDILPNAAALSQTQTQQTTTSFGSIFLPFISRHSTPDWCQLDKYTTHHRSHCKTARAMEKPTLHDFTHTHSHSHKHDQSYARRLWCREILRDGMQEDDCEWRRFQIIRFKF